MSTNEVKSMLRKVIVYDFIVGYTTASILYFTYKEFTVAYLSGLIISVINFIVNGIITERALSTNASTGIFFVSIKSLKVVLICLVPIILFKNNTHLVLVYALGFTSHFIALVLYSIFNGKS